MAPRLGRRVRSLLRDLTISGQGGGHRKDGGRKRRAGVVTFTKTPGGSRPWRGWRRTRRRKRS